MACSRKDSKGRRLRDGESERADGRYCFRYTDDRTGKRHSVYAKSLSELREKERQIEKDREDGILLDSAVKKRTLNEQFEEYLLIKELAETTKVNYIKTWNNRVKDEIGNYKVVQLRVSDIKKFYIKLSKAGYSYSTIKLIHNLIYPALEMAVEDDIIRKNPAKNALSSDMGTEPQDKIALSSEQQKKLLSFVKNSSIYNVHEHMLVIMLETGVRCGELIGLTWENVDMQKREIVVEHQLVYKNWGDGSRFHITTPKTDAGRRTIPMTQVVHKAFLEQKKLNFMLGRHCTEEVDGYSDFIFLTKTGKPLMPAAVNNVLYNIVDAYNKAEVSNARRERRNAVLLPKFSAHVLRHTACTNLARRGINIKALQYVMGHAHSDVTLDVYNHMSNADDVREEMFRLEQMAVGG